MREKNGMVYMDYDEWIAHKRARTAFHQELCPVPALLKEGRGVSELSCTCPQHLPECIFPKGYGDCICGELRACEQRLTEGWCKAVCANSNYEAGLDAAREAVEALMGAPSDQDPTPLDFFIYEEVLPVIDALRREQR